eukprot:1403061-Prymnesium_polylepis.1
MVSVSAHACTEARTPTHRLQPANTQALAAPRCTRLEPCNEPYNPSIRGRVCTPSTAVRECPSGCGRAATSPSAQRARRSAAATDATPPSRAMHRGSTRAATSIKLVATSPMAATARVACIAAPPGNSDGGAAATAGGESGAPSAAAALSLSAACRPRRPAVGGHQQNAAS